MLKVCSQHKINFTKKLVTIGYVWGAGEGKGVVGVPKQAVEWFSLRI